MANYNPYDSQAFRDRALKIVSEDKKTNRNNDNISNLMYNKPITSSTTNTTADTTTDNFAQFQSNGAKSVSSIKSIDNTSVSNKPNLSQSQPQKEPTLGDKIKSLTERYGTGTFGQKKIEQELKYDKKFAEIREHGQRGIQAAMNEAVKGKFTSSARITQNLRNKQIY